MDQWLSTRRQFLGSASLLLAGCATVPRVVKPNCDAGSDVILRTASSSEITRLSRT